MTIAKITLHRGSGRKLKRPRINRETLFYAVAYVFCTQQLATNVGGTSRNWMSLIGARTAELLLAYSQSELDDWLTHHLLDIPNVNTNQTT